MIWKTFNHSQPSKKSLKNGSHMPVHVCFVEPTSIRLVSFNLWIQSQLFFHGSLVLPIYDMCVFMFMDVCMCVCFVCIYIYIYMCVYVCVCKCVCMYVFIYIHIYILYIIFKFTLLKHYLLFIPQLIRIVDVD